MVGIATGVQYLHCNFTAFCMHGICNLTVLRRFSSGAEFAGEGIYPASAVRCVTARDYQADLTSSALGEIGCKTIVITTIFEACVHGAHEDPVLQCCEAEVEWGE